MARAAAMTNRGVVTTRGVVYLTDMQEAVMCCGFIDPKRTFAFEADTCSKAVALRLSAKGLVERSVRHHHRCILTLTDVGREVMAELRRLAHREGLLRPEDT
jgi:hypothetical protein